MAKRGTLKAGDRVEYGTFGPGGGDRLGEIQRPERKHRQDGYLIIPLSLTPGDGYLPMWYPADRVQSWQPDRWSCNAARNTWARTAQGQPGRGSVSLASQRRARAEEAERLVRGHHTRTAPGELARAWDRRREQTARLVRVDKIDPAKVDYRELRGRPGAVDPQLREAQEHLLNCRFPQADEALGRAVQYLRESPGGGGRARRSVEELRAWIRTRVTAARRP